MKVDTLPIGLYEENIYILHDKKQVLIIDPGRNASYIRKFIGEDETVQGILLTHGHDDHVGAADDLADYYHCDIYLHESDKQLTDPKESDKYMFGSPVYTPVKGFQEEMQIGAFSLKVYHTPGHTEGSVCIQYRNVLFSGDTLFAGSIGRTDLFSGDDAKMIASLKMLVTLPQDLTVYPGHGPSTSIGQEIRSNPYLHYFGII